MFIKILIGVILFYIVIFLTTILITKIVDFYRIWQAKQKQKENEIKIRPQNKIKKKKYVNKKWNSSLGVWEIDE